MRLLFALTYYAPHWTGLTQYARMLGEGLVKRGHDVTVVTTRFLDDLPEREVIGGVHVVRAKPSIHFSRSALSLGLIRAFGELMHASDVAVCFMPFDSVFFAARAAKQRGKRLFLVHNGDLVLPRGPVNRAIEYAFRQLTGASIRMSDGIIVNTTDYAEHSRLLSRFRDKWIPLVPPITSLPATDEGRRLLRSKLASTPSRLIGFSGRFVEEKGFDILIKAIPRVLDRAPDAHFAFAGEVNIAYENFYARVEDAIRASRNLTMLGRLPREHMGAFYEACDLLAMPSRSDFFPFVQAEAMLGGLPSVVSDIPGARWLVQQTGMGRLTPPEQPDALADALVDALGRLDDFRARRPLVEAIFDHEPLMNRYETLFAHGRA